MTLHVTIVLNFGKDTKFVEKTANFLEIIFEKNEKMFPIWGKIVLLTSTYYII